MADYHRGYPRLLDSHLRTLWVHPPSRKKGTRVKNENKRGVVQSVAANLLDLGFTPSAIAGLLNKSVANIYVHLDKAGRYKAGTYARQYPDKVLDGTLSVLKKTFRDHKCVALMLVAMGRATTPMVEKLPASVTKLTSKKYAKKAA